VTLSYMKVSTAIVGSVALSLMIVSGCSRTAPVNVSPTETRQQIMTGPINYVALGDSTGAGVGARNGGYVARLFTRIKLQRPDSTLANLCVSGATTEDVLRDQLDAGIRKQPNLVTLGIGINDIGHGFSTDRFSKNYEQIVSRLKNETPAVIVVSNIPDVSTAPSIPIYERAEYHRRIVLFNERLAEIASRHGVEVFDVYNATHQQLDSRPELFSADGFHPSDAGYELWAELMWPTTARSIGIQP
jgi:acyl-CoA thioesterase-1